MECFTNQVRTGGVPQPTQKSFTLEKWQQAYEKIEKPSEQDTRLYRTGIWAFNKFEAIRRKLAPLWLQNFSKEQLRLMYVGMANRDCALISEARLPVTDEKFFVVEQAIQAKLDQENNAGPAAHPEVFITSSIDGVSFPIRHTFTQKQTTSALIPDEEVIGRILNTNVLGQFYSIMEDYWMQALWNGWYIETNDDDVDLMMPSEEIFTIISVVSHFRHQVLSSETTTQIIKSWLHKLPEEIKLQMLKQMPQVILKGTGKKRQYIVRKCEVDNNVSMLMLINRYKALAGYYYPLTDSPLPKLKNISLGTLLQAWEMIQALAEAFRATLPTVEDSGVTTVEKLLKYSPTIYTDQLVSLLQNWLGYSQTDTQKIVDFFSYYPKSKSGLWAQPLVKVGNGRLAPLLGPLIYGNIERTFELWMKEGDLQLTDKGPLFESYARNELQDALAKSDILKNSEVYPKSVKMKHEETHEEIDIIIRIRNVLLLGEAKCLLFPSEPIEFSRYYEVLKGAASQIKRKVDFAKKHSDILINELKLQNLLETEELELYPFVLVNQPFGAGFVVDDIPVTDLWILTRYFDGKWHRMVTFSRDGQQTTGSTFFFYKSEDEAAQQVKLYLDSPPQLEHYQQNIQPTIHKYPLIDNKDRKFAVGRLEVVLPFPEVKFKIGIGD